MKTFTEDQIANLLEEQKQDEISKYDIYKSEGMTLMEVDWKDGTHECLELSEIAQMFKFAGGVATHDDATDEWVFKMFKTNSEWKNYTLGGIPAQSNQ